MNSRALAQHYFSYARHCVPLPHLKFSNPTIGTEGEYTKYTENIDGWAMWNRRQTANDPLGQDNSTFIYANGMPKTKYLKKGEVWDTYSVSINNFFALGKYWSLFSRHHTRFTVLGLTKTLNILIKK